MQRSAGGKHTLGRAADAHVDVDAGPSGSAVWITPATSPSVISATAAPSCAPRDEIMCAAVEMSAVISEAFTPFALASLAMFRPGRIEIDDALRIAGADRDLLM